MATQQCLIIRQCNIHNGSHNRRYHIEFKAHGCQAVASPLKNQFLMVTRVSARAPVSRPSGDPASKNKSPFVITSFCHYILCRDVNMNCVGIDIPIHLTRV